MLLLSVGLTWGTFCSKEAMLTSGTRMTMPVTWAGSSAAMSFSMAMMEVYSVPWAPEMRARVFPGFAPFTTTTGMLVAGSAAAVPTVKEDCACAAMEKKSAIPMVKRIGRRRRIIHPQEDMEDSAEGTLRQREERKTRINTENTETQRTQRRRAR